jgi:hypothetical protein
LECTDCAQTTRRNDVMQTFCGYTSFRFGDFNYDPHLPGQKTGHSSQESECVTIYQYRIQMLGYECNRHYICNRHHPVGLLVSDRGHGRPNGICVCTRERIIDFGVDGVVTNQRTPETQSDRARWERRSCSMEFYLVRFSMLIDLPVWVLKHHDYRK